MPCILIKWRLYRCKDVRGSDIEINFPATIDCDNRGLLLNAIMQMPEKTAIGFDEALTLAWEKQNEAFDARKIGHNPGEYFWYSFHFVEWISSLGYHIEMTGDEFDILHPSEWAA